MSNPPSNPPRLFIIPEVISKDAKVITLAHPRSFKPTRYYFCPVSGIYEFLRVAAPKDTLSSLLLAPPAEIQPEKLQQETRGMSLADSPDNLENASHSMTSGYITTAELVTATKIDALFLLLPMLSPMDATTKAKSITALFQSTEALFDQLLDLSKHFSILLNHAGSKDLMLRRLQAVCDSVDAGEEMMYRLNTDKLLQELVRKARRMVAIGLPQSMEQTLVQKALEPPTPMLLRGKDDADEVRRFVEKAEEAGTRLALEQSEEADPTTTPILEHNPNRKAVLQTAHPYPSNLEQTEYLPNADSFTSRESRPSLGATISTPDESAEFGSTKTLVHLLRLRTALSYLLAVYVPSPLAATLSEKLAASTSPIDFALLDLHLSNLSSLRTASADARSFSEVNRKRGYDDSTLEARLEKKKKQDEEEKRKKAGTSRGVRDLRKVSVQGMKKMSDFFSQAGSRKK